ncbi:MAG: hypothetical protein ABSD99_09155 [Candidatus Bathyarchaeia archaeon]
MTVDTLDSLGCYRWLDFTGNVKVAVGGKTCQYAVDEHEHVKLRKIKKNHFSQDEPYKKGVSVEDLTLSPNEK